MPAPPLPTWGLPGAAIGSALADRLILGGGGGAGHYGHADVGGACKRPGTEAPAGGGGGGAVIIVAAVIDGTGAISAGGGAGECSNDNGAGGGGAGGTLWITAGAGGFAGQLTAVGGAGGHAFERSGRVGPGGGGGGGHARVSGLPAGVMISAGAGAVGLHSDSPGLLLAPDPWGATAGRAGAVDRP
jgi:hypothetical protein